MSLTDEDEPFVYVRSFTVRTAARQTPEIDKEALQAYIRKVLGSNGADDDTAEAKSQA